jgi:hypothetical protein
MDMLNLYLRERMAEQELAARRTCVPSHATHPWRRRRRRGLEWLGRNLIVLGMRLPGEDARTATLIRYRVPPGFSQN